MIFQKIAEWFTGRKRTDEKHPLDYINNKYGGEPAVSPAPPKVEPPAEPVVQTQPEPTKCGCGRSSTGLCVGLHRMTQAEWAVHADNPQRTDSIKEVKRPRQAAKPKVKPEVEKKPQAKKKPANKPAAKKEAAKKAAVPVKTRPTKKAKSV